MFCSLSVLCFVCSLPPATKLGQGNIFRSMCQEFCSWGGRYPSMPCRSPGPHPGEVEESGLGGDLQAHTQGEVEGSGLGGSPGPHPGGRGLQAHTQGVFPGPQPGGLQTHTQGVSQHTLRQTPPQSRQLLLRAVCILLECILVTGRNEVEAKVIFLHLSVIHSVHKGGGLPQCMLGYHTPPGVTPPRADTPNTPPDQTSPGADPPWSRPPAADPPQSRRSTSGRYASYWNAFLL